MGVIICKKETKSTLAQFLHGACFSPVKTTLLNAIDKNHFTTWPGFTTKLVRKHLLTPIATAQGHQNQEKQNLQSTKKRELPENIDEIRRRYENLKLKAPSNQPFKETLEKDIFQDSFPESDEPNIRTNTVLYKIVSSSPKGMGYTDLTGRFPYRSSRGHEYIMIAYNYDANCILVEPLKNRQGQSITTVWNTMHKQFSIAGVDPHIYVLDNEVSSELKRH